MAGRQLGYWETMCALYEQYQMGSGLVVQSLCFQGPVDAEVAASALLCLQGKHPLLQVGLVEKDGVLYFEDGPFQNLAPQDQRIHLPLAILSKEDPHHWQRVATLESNRYLPQARYLWRAVLLLDPTPQQEHDFILIVDHAICDGLSLARLGYDFVCILAGETVNAAPTMFPPAVEQRIPHPEESVPSAPPSMAPLRQPFDNFAPLESRSCGFIWETFDKEASSAIIGKCRENGTKINGLLLSLAGSWLYQQFPEIEGPQWIPSGLAVSLRGVCEPPMGDDLFGCFVGLASPNCLFDPERDIWAQARAYQQAIVTSFEEGRAAGFFPKTFDTINLRESVKASAESLNKEHSFGSPLAISNIGALPFPTEIGTGYALKSLYFWTAQYAGYFLLPMTLLSLGGCIHFCFGYTQPLVRKETAEELVEYLKRELHALL